MVCFTDGAVGCAALAPLGLVWSGWLPATKTAIEFFWMDVVLVAGVAHARKPFCIYKNEFQWFLSLVGQWVVLL